MVTWVVVLSFLASSFCLETEKLDSKVKVGRKVFKCTFNVAWEGTQFNVKKSTVACKPKKKAQVTKFKVEGSKGTFTLDFSIKPPKITRGTFDPFPTTPSLTSPPPTSGPILTCSMGFTHVCSLAPASNCSQGMVSRCFGTSPSTATAATPACTCLPTAMVESALAAGSSPLGSCHKGCLCLPAPLLSCPQAHCSAATDGPVFLMGQSYITGKTELLGGSESCSTPTFPLTLASHENPTSFITRDCQRLVCGGLPTFSNGSLGTNPACFQVLTDNGDLHFRYHSELAWDHPWTTKSQDGVVLDSGAYLVKGKYTVSTSFLATGSTTWVPGPTLPGPTPGYSGADCAVRVSPTSFVVLGFSRNATRVVRYEETTDTWSELPPLPSDPNPPTTAGFPHIGLQSHKCLLYSEGKILVTGGQPVFTTYALRSTFLYSISDGSVRPLGPMVHPRLAHTMVRSGGRVLVLGGWDYGANLYRTVEELDPETETWHVIDTKLSIEMLDLAAIVLPGTESTYCN